MRLITYWSKKNVRWLVGGIVVAIAASFALGGSTVVELEDSSTTDEAADPAVTLTSARELTDVGTLSLIGTVRPLSAANISSERAGRVTRVYVELGRVVAAGSLIAELENASERAAVLQAEGAYEAALASAEQSGIGVREAEEAVDRAERAALNTYRSAYTTVNGVILNNIDQFFARPESTIPGVRIDGRGQTDFLNRERVAYQTLLPEWQQETQTLTTEDNLTEALQEADDSVTRTITLVDTFIALFNDQGSNSRYTDAELQGFSTSFTTLRSNLLNLQNQIDSAASSLTSARDALARAELGASGSERSAADAQIKQALGSLRAAQANLAKTQLRTPISGTVNSLSVQPGDFVGSFTQVAEVANNDALEIITAVSQTERDRITIGDTVRIADRATGTISTIAPAVSERTGKLEVRIVSETTDELVSGDTVRIETQADNDPTPTDSEPIRIPLTAVKFNNEDGSILTVNTENILEEQPVELGSVRGGTVEILSGLERDTAFVLDVRGLVAGQAVSVPERN